jgi:hypothetical protein
MGLNFFDLTTSTGARQYLRHSNKTENLASGELQQLQTPNSKFKVTTQPSCHFEKRSDEKSTRTFDGKR